MRLWFGRKQAPLPPWIQTLRSVPIFAPLSNRELSIISQIAHVRSYLDGEIIFEEGDEGLGMYVVLEGAVLLRRRAGQEVRQVGRVEPGVCFGELALLDGGPRSASAVAEGATRLLFFFRPEFMDVLETHGRLGARISLAIARHTAARLRRAVSRCEEI